MAKKDRNPRKQEVKMTTKPNPEMPTPIHPQTKIGHIHLTVADLERSLAFYRDLLGFEVTMRYTDSAVFLSAGGYHHQATCGSI
jgi:catechol 2,3-dioxygenase